MAAFSQPKLGLGRASKSSQCSAGGASALPPTLRGICEVEDREEAPLEGDPAIHVVSGTSGVGCRPMLKASEIANAASAAKSAIIWTGRR